jgi:anti-sigma factor RsiW
MSVMKPCSKNRKLIAWLALEVLDAQQTQELRAHLGTCAGCRRYLEEISRITERLSAAETGADIQASESFHRKVVGRLRAEEAASVWQTVIAQLRGRLLDWRVAALTSGALVAAFAVLFLSLRLPTAPRFSSADDRGARKSILKSDLDPTIGNYQMVANQSMEKLDELLTRQSHRNLSAVPIYTASTPAPE